MKKAMAKKIQGSARPYDAGFIRKRALITHDRNTSDASDRQHGEGVREEGVRTHHQRIDAVKKTDPMT